ncbi:MAG: tetratricopeptide repeat protein, partial [Trueperaceae bacterium]
MQRSEAANAFSAYLPQDRLRQLSGGEAVPERGRGSVLFADVVGFTGLTTRLAELYGPRRGAEEVPVYLNRLYEALNTEVQRRGGSVIGFAGDAITCWFAADDGRLAVACGLAMQQAMAPFGELALRGAGKGETISLALKVAVTTGSVRRFVVGDPRIQRIDVIAGGPVAQIEALEGFVSKGQVVVSGAVAGAVGEAVRFVPIAQNNAAQGAVHAWLADGPAADPSLGADTGSTVPTNQELEPLAQWLLPTVQRRLSSGKGDFLTELRPVAALFLSFGGIDVAEDGAPTQFNQVVCAAQQVAADYGGNVLQVTSGDKGNYLYMAFGAPVSHEDDAQRCASAALELRDALEQLGSLTHMAMGLGYGTARTGAYGSEARRTYGALGEGTNMAARMMSKAPHGCIYASNEFVASLGHGFQLTELAPQHIKGRTEPVRAFELIARDGSGPAELGSGPGSLVGRAEELAFLRANLDAAAQGEGRIVQLVADAGMGKSELIKHLLARSAAADEAPATAATRGGSDTASLHVVRGAGQAYGRTAPYRLWKSVFHGLLNLNEASPASERVTATLAALADLDAGLADQAQLLGPVLDLPLGGAADTGADAEARSAARRTLLLNVFRSAARRLAAAGSTLVLVLEDLHWLDPASEELLRALAPTVAALPVLVLTTSRPAETVTEPPPGTLEGALQLELAPLDPAAAAAVATAHLAGAGINDNGAALVEAVVERSGGNPFYLQELVTDLIQRASSGSVQAALGGLPTSLHALLLGRMDRLEDHQQAHLKVASVVGREFRTAWVAACQPGTSEAHAEEAFEATGSVGLTARLAVRPAAHEFNHAITHEVAYESQPHSNRSRLHTALARFVEANVATPDEPHLDMLAHHYWLGDDADKARAYLQAAGAAAQAAYANPAALRYFGRLLELQDGAERLPTLLDLGEVESFVGGYAAAERHLAAALQLAREAGSRRDEAGARRRMGELYERQGDHDKARGELELAATVCRELGDDVELTRVLLALGGNVLWHLGELGAAEAQLRQAVALAHAAGDVRSAARALHGLANVLYDRGNQKDAELALAESLAMRRAANDDYGVANALNNLAVMYAEAGDGARAEELF